MKNKIIMAVALVAALLTFGACHDDAVRQYSLNAHMEQLAGTNGKVALYHEQWTYWEYDDEIRIASDQSTGGEGPVSAFLSGGAGGDFAGYDGVFIASLVDGSKYFAGLHPYSDYHSILPTSIGSNTFNISAWLNPEQGYRNDSTYAKQVLPMVAVFNGEWDDAHPDPYRLDFHSLAGLVRLQLLNGTSSETRVISGITLTTTADSPWKALCGIFKVKNPATNNPMLDKETKVTQATSEDTTMLTLGMPSGGMELAPDSLRSFYVVLPSRHGMDATTSYKLQMAVTTTATDGTDEKVLYKTFSVNVRRNGITYLRAINITDFGEAANTNPSGNNPVLVGNGTEWRPFKIYTTADLRYVRDQFASPRTDGFVYINGQKVTSNTYFRIMRSDIVLEASGSNAWTAGIPNFVGRMGYYANISAEGHNTAFTGIENRTTVPLFASIASGGVVDGIAVRCESTIEDLVPSHKYSPFCDNNYGVIVNCHVATQHPTNTLNYLDGSAFAGICVTNYGTIDACGASVKGTVSSSSGADFAGICHTNTASGTITGCFATTPLAITGPTRAAGVCLYNNGTVTASYYAARIDNGGSTPWGGLVYQNNAGAIIQRCYIGSGARLYSHTVGGIVHTNAGTVDMCRCDAQLAGHLVGGVAAEVTAGIIQNCYVNDSLFTITFLVSGTNTYCGALVGDLQGGTIQNSFANIANLLGSGTGKGAIAGHTAAGSAVTNTYANIVNSDTKFYGVDDGATFTNCYNVRVTHNAFPMVANTASGLSTLHTNLNGGRGSGDLVWIRDLTGLGDEEQAKRLPELELPAGPSVKHK